MKSKKIVITGAEGFIATNLIFKLSKIKGYNLFGIDSSIAKSSNKNFTKDIIKNLTIKYNNYKKNKDEEIDQKNREIEAHQRETENFK